MSKSSSPRRRSGRQRGVTLIEALVALLVMSFGMLALVGLMTNLRRGADLAKQRTEAMRIARAELAALRDFGRVNNSTGVVGGPIIYFDDFPEGAQSFTHTDSNTVYTLRRQITALRDGAASAPVVANQVRVTVSWTDRANDPQFVNLDTVIARVEPVFSAIVGMTPRMSAVTQPSGRNPVIPADAIKIDRNISAFRPSALGSTVWVFNNFTGVVTNVCSIDVTANLATGVTSCLASTASTTSYLLSGTVRFSNTSPANPTTPEAGSLPVGIQIAGGNTYAVPQLDGSGNRRSGTTDIPVTTAAMTGATSLAPRTYYCFNNYVAATTAQGYVTYHCLVTPDDSVAGAPRAWSAQVRLTGLDIGTTASQYRVCRYSADYNANDSNLLADGRTIDNLEHPLVYATVTGSLTRQNFLVVRGDVSCPRAPAVDPTAGIFADYSTVQLQPEP